MTHDIGSDVRKRYSQKAISAIMEALKTASADVRARRQTPSKQAGS